MPTSKVSARRGPALQSPPTGWRVQVSVTVLELVPKDIAFPWIVLESYARDQGACWPGNKALADRLGVTIRGAQLALERLEDHGIIVRRQHEGNRRSIVLARRVAEDLSPADWRAMADGALRRAEGRAAAAELKKVRRPKPKLKVVG